MNDNVSLIVEIQNELVLRICNEGIPRIIKCLSELSENQLWFCHNENITSIANLILHLNGNVRQWFLEGFCAIDYKRTRDKEFNARKTHTKDELIALMNSLSFDIQNNINKINLDLLLAKKRIQDHFLVSGYSIISHITEHFSYHVGQITTLTKLLINKDLKYYANYDL